MTGTGLIDRDVSALRPYPGNARTHSKKQIKQIAASIERFGITNPVLVSDEGEIIAGHGIMPGSVRSARIAPLNWPCTPRSSPLR